MAKDTPDLPDISTALVELTDPEVVKYRTIVLGLGLHEAVEAELLGMLEKNNPNFLNALEAYTIEN